MTTGEWLASLSTAPQGSTMLDVVGDIEGTFPVLTPVESFGVDFNDRKYHANLAIIATSANLEQTALDADISEDKFSANLEMEAYNGY